MSVNIWSNGKLVPIASSGSYVYNMPLGSIIAFSGDNIPSGFLLCDGSTLNKNEYLDLFNVIGYTYGGSDNEFKLPDLRETVIVGTGENKTLTIAEHDVYALGEFKDDQFQGHAHVYYNNSSDEGASYNNKQVSDDPENRQVTQEIVPYGSFGNPRYNTTTHGKQMGLNYIIKATYFVSNIQAEKPFAVCNSLIDAQNKAISIPNLINIQPGTEISVLFANGNSYGSCVGTDSNIIADGVKISLNDGTPYPIKVGGENAGEGFCRAGDVHKFVFDGSAWNDLTADVIYQGETENGNYVKKRNGLIEQFGLINLQSEINKFPILYNNKPKINALSYGFSYDGSNYFSNIKEITTTYFIFRIQWNSEPAKNNSWIAYGF